MTKIEYNGMTFSDENDQIISGEIYDAVSLISDVIEVGTFKAEVRVSDDTEGQKLRAFKRNDQLLCFHNNRQLGVWYVENVERTSKYTYEISANNAVALLDGSKHYGGIYTGHTAGELIADICTIPHYVKPSMASQKLYGWLPAASRRSNLAQVLFAIGAYAWVDEVGLLRIGPLWDGVSNYIGEDSIKAGDKVKYASKITEVTVLEHTYDQGEEEVTLFDGTAASGDIITFNEPAHSLTASGVTILESGANYVKISAGTGTVTGKKYIHTTRDVRLHVSDSDVDNAKEVKTATLVSLTNSMAVAQRLAAYYKCCETVQHDSIFHNQAPGAVISFNHPFDGDVVGCIKSSGIKIGAQKIISEEKIISGFLPPQPSNLEYYDTREVLTVSGSFTVPAGVTHIRAVLIGGAYGGKPGNPGETGGVGKKFTYTSSVSGTSTYWRTLGLGGKGGLGGEGGQAGKVLVVDIDVTPGQVITFNIGTGGPADSAGTATTFGARSSEDGSVLPDGYVDPVTGDVYATTGDVGLPGGDGNGWAGGDITRTNALNIAQGAPVGEYGPGENSLETVTKSGYYVYYYIMSGGGARNQNGSIEGGSLSKDISACKGGKGADATYIPDKPSVPGKGGTGGSGGGGGGGAAAAEMKSSTDAAPLGGDGGLGTIGGIGADGALILYYAKPKIVPSGRLMGNNGHFVLDRTGRLIVV